MNSEVSPSQTNAASDEINLVDLMRVLIKRKNILFVVLALIVLSGVVIAFLVSPKYKYTTTIEIGSVMVGDEVRLIDKPGSLKAKLQESYIPNVLRHYRKTHPDSLKKYKILVRIPNNSEIIVLESNGNGEEADIHMQFQVEIFEEIVKDHGRIFNSMQRSYRQQIENIQNEISALENQSRSLQHKFKQLAENENLTIESMYKRDRIENELMGIHFDIMEKKSELIKVELQSESLRETRAITPPIKSLEPVGFSKKMIILFSVVLGFFVALFAAFIHEFIVKARDEMS